MRQQLRIACLAATLGILTTVAVPVVNHAVNHSYTDVALTDKFVEHQSWAVSHVAEMNTIKAAVQQGATVELSHLLYGIFPVFMDSSSKPFIVSSTGIKYLEKLSDGNWGLRPIDRADLRIGANGQRVEILNADAFDTISAAMTKVGSFDNLTATNIATNDRILTSGSPLSVHYVANGVYCGEVQVYHVGGTYALPISAVDHLGLTYSKSVNHVDFIFKDSTGNNLKYSVIIGAFNGAPQLFKFNDSVVIAPTLMKFGDNLFISTKTLVDVMNFEANYNDSTNVLSITSDPGDIVIPVTAANSEVNLDNKASFISVPIALKSGILNSDGTAGHFGASPLSASKPKGSSASSKSAPNTRSIASASSSSSNSSQSSQSNGNSVSSQSSTPAVTQPTQPQQSSSSIPAHNNPPASSRPVNSQPSSSDTSYVFDTTWKTRAQVQAMYPGMQLVVYTHQFKSSTQQCIRVADIGPDMSVTPEEAYKELNAWVTVDTNPNFETKSNVDILNHRALLYRAMESTDEGIYEALGGGYQSSLQSAIEIAEGIALPYDISYSIG